MTSQAYKQQDLESHFKRECNNFSCNNFSLCIACKNQIKDDFQSLLHFPALDITKCKHIFANQFIILQVNSKFHVNSIMNGKLYA